MGGSPVSLDPVVIPLIEGPRILDVGCGFGKWGYLCHSNYWETINPKKGERPTVVGVDGYKPNVEMALRGGCYRDCICDTVPPLPFEDQSFDTVLLIEIVEHLTDSDACELIEEAKRVASKRIVVSTPNYPDFRGGHETITGFNELDAHLSYWSRARLKNLGFAISGSGWKSQNRYWRGLLRWAGLLEFYDRKFRPSMSSVSALVPIAAENTVAVWIRS